MMANSADGNSDDSERLELQSKLQERRAVVQRELVAIAMDSRRLNEMVPIAKLNTDILIEIFSVLSTRELIAPKCFDGSDLNDPYEWIYIAHVCHRWRRILLDTPQYWSTLYFASMPELEELLSRSKHAPLRITFSTIPLYIGQYHLGLPYSPRQRRRRWSAIELAFKHVPRFAEVALDIPLAYMNRVAGMASKHSLRMLTRLVLSNTPASGPSGSVESGSDAIPFSNCEVPSLTQLALCGFRIDWQMALLVPTLTQLALQPRRLGTPPDFENPDTPTPFSITMKRLSTLPLLTRLVLNGPGLLSTPSNTRVLDATEVVRLPRLQELLIQEKGSALAVFIQHLDIPANCRMEVYILTENYNEMESVAVAIARRLQVNQGENCDLRITGLAMATKIGSAETIPTIECYAANASLHDRYWNGMDVLPIVKLRFIDSPYSPNFSPDSLNCIRCLVRPLPLSHINELHIEPLRARLDEGLLEADQFLSESLHRMSPEGIRFLSVSSLAFFHLPKMLNTLCEVPIRHFDDTLPGGNQRRAEDTFVPYASHMFRNLEAMSFRHYALMSSFDDWTINARELLQRALLARKHHSAAFCKLRLQGCSCCLPDGALDLELLRAFERMCSQEGKFTSLLGERNAEPHVPEFRWDDETMVLKTVPVEQPHDWVWEVGEGRQVIMDFRTGGGLEVQPGSSVQGVIGDPGVYASWSPFP
ncbi:hypothetical protein K474DRAFT_1690236 [Panus rudis PR-1116 ss-1]|nr:hypothetical protein K474DRAFT_1690236 [Panus rudis PR-1116 ss-1]